MVKLYNSPGAFIFDAVCQFCQTFDSVIAPYVGLMGHTHSPFLYGSDLDNDQSEAACRPCSVIVKRGLRNVSFRAEYSGIHSGHSKTVLNHKISDFVRCKGI